MENCNQLPTPTRVEAPLGTDANGSEAKNDWTNSYDSIIAMMLYMSSNTIPYTSFAVQQCTWCTHNTKASHEKAVKRICRYLQGTKDNVLVFNAFKKLVVYCYVDADFARLFFARSRNGFVVTFSNCLLLWVSKIQIEISIPTRHSGYVAFSHSVRELLPLKVLSRK